MPTLRSYAGVALDGPSDPCTRLRRCRSVVALDGPHENHDREVRISVRELGLAELLRGHSGKECNRRRHVTPAGGFDVIDSEILPEQLAARELGEPPAID